jgi:D-ribose pyranose/furanose isomerase RbsD
MVPIGMVAEGVAIKPGVIEIVQTVKILRCELIVSELVVAKLIVRELVSTAV